MQQARLAAWLQRELGAQLRAMAPVGGGCIHRAWRLELADGRRLFAKTNRASQLPVLAAEAEGLTALGGAAGAARAAQTTPAPRLTLPEPLQLAELEGEALLLLSWLDLAGDTAADGTAAGGTDQAWHQLGAALAELHRASLCDHDGRFGWARDNFIGSGPQPNGWEADWGLFFSQQRLGWQLRWAARSGHRLEGAEALLDQVPSWLSDHRPEACLVHGDLWSGNAALLRPPAGGHAWGGTVFDPAVYRGDREVDLAMAQLFGGFPAAFYTGYDAAWPRPQGHRQRVPLYNLYHLLNHANLFGGGYWGQAERRIQALLQNPPA
jgi:fructosamine-3-kinase